MEYIKRFKPKWTVVQAISSVMTNDTYATYLGKRYGSHTVLVGPHVTALPRLIARRGEHFSDGQQNRTRSLMEKWLKLRFRIEEVMYFGYFAYPLLGFPDRADLFKYIPVKSVAGPLLMAINKCISRISLIRT